MSGLKRIAALREYILSEQISEKLIAELQQNIEMLAIALDAKNYQEQFKKGFQLISDYKNFGGIQREAYDTLLVLSENIEKKQIKNRLT